VGQAVFLAGEAGAQSRAVVQTAHYDTLLAQASAVVTVAFTVRNDRAKAIRAEPTVAVPKGWSVVVGGAPFNIAAKAREVWLIGIAPTATASAGTYGIRASLTADGDTVVTDSLFVRVPERRALEVFPGEAPSYAMAGDDFPVTFFVRNNGNVEATYSLRAASSIGVVPSLEPQSLVVQPGATVTVSSRVTSGNAAVAWGTHENIVQLRATDDADSTVASSVSIHTTIVPRSRRWLDQLSTVPAQLTLRSVGPNAGVSPASLFGSGSLGPESNTQVDFAFRAPVSGTPVYGERDEYRLAVTSDHYRVRLGDNLYGFSQLSSSWVSGFGAEARGEVAGVTAGAYVKQDRWTRTPGSERAFLFGTSTQAPFSASVIGVDRTGGPGADARMGTFTSQARLGTSLVEVEGAVSDSAGIRGEAQRARISGDYTRLSYDVSLTRGSPEFVGRDRGQTTGHAGFSTRLTDWAALTANTSTLSYIPTLDVLGFSRVRSTSVEGSLLHGRLGLVYEEMTRADSGAFATLGGHQRGGRIRTSIPLGLLDLFTDVAGGTARSADSAEKRYSSMSMTLHASLLSAGSLEFFVQRSENMLFEMSGLNAATTAQIHLPGSTTLFVSAYGNVPTGQTKLYYAQIDAEIAHTLRNGMTVALRDRMTNSMWRVTEPRQNLLFLELRAPLRIPTGLTRTTGMARGRILDEETGRGVGGVLVRLGPEAAVTDAQGRVAFASLPPGRYHASVDGGTASRLSDALLTGDVAVEVLPESRQPVDFSLSLVRGGQVRVDVRQFEFATTMATSAPDSLVDTGGFAGAMVALVGGRDTIYQVTNQAGTADFRDVPVGQWTVQMIGATLPAAHALDVEARPIGVKASETTSVALRIVPKRKSVRFVDPAPVIVAKPKSKGD
jgi:hypothetical protein